MGSILTAATAWLRDYTTAGNPATGWNKPVKTEGITLFDEVEDRIEDGLAAEAAARAEADAALAAGAANPLGLVATRCMVPNHVNTEDQQMTRWSQYMRVGVTRFKIVIPNWYVSATTGLETPTSATSTVRAAIEYPVGVFTQVLFEGLVSGSILSGNDIVSDWIALPIATGEKFWTRIWMSNGLGCPNWVMSTPITGDGFVVGATTTPDLTMGGTVAQSTLNQFGPSAIIGETTAASFFCLGDSLVVGAFDTPTVLGETGTLARSVGPSFAYINAGGGSYKASQFITSFARRVSLSRYCTHVFIGYGVNDLGTSTGAQLLLDLASAVKKFKNWKGQDPRVWVATITPRSTSSDGWTTLGNQTTFANNGERIIANAGIRAGIVGAEGQTVGFFEIANEVESAVDSGKWKVTFGPYTGDGTHGNAAAYFRIESQEVIDPDRWAR